MSKTFTATDENGKTHTRTSQRRTYTNVVLSRSGGNTSWSVQGWCGRPDLAEKKAISIRSWGLEVCILAVDGAKPAAVAVEAISADSIAPVVEARPLLAVGQRVQISIGGKHQGVITKVMGKGKSKGSDYMVQVENEWNDHERFPTKFLTAI